LFAVVLSTIRGEQRFSNDGVVYAIRAWFKYDAAALSAVV